MHLILNTTGRKYTTFVVARAHRLWVFDSRNRPRTHRHDRTATPSVLLVARPGFCMLISVHTCVLGEMMGRFDQATWWH